MSTKLVTAHDETGTYPDVVVTQFGGPATLGDNWLAIYVEGAAPERGQVDTVQMSLAQWLEVCRSTLVLYEPLPAHPDAASPIVEVTLYTSYTRAFVVKSHILAFEITGPKSYMQTGPFAGREHFRVNMFIGKSTGKDDWGAFACFRDFATEDEAVAFIRTTAGGAP